MLLCLLMLGEDKHKSVVGFRQTENRHMLKTTCVNHIIFYQITFVLWQARKEKSKQYLWVWGESPKYSIVN